MTISWASERTAKAWSACASSLCVPLASMDPDALLVDLGLSQYEMYVLEVVLFASCGGFVLPEQLSCEDVTLRDLDYYADLYLEQRAI